MRFQFLFVGPTRGRDSRGRHNGSRDFHRRYDSNHRERDNRQDRRGNDDTSGENKQWRGNKNTKCFSCGAYGQIGRFCPKKGRTHNAESPKEEPSSSSNLVEHSHFTCLAEVADESVINESVINKSVTNINWAVKSHFCPFENLVKNMSAVDNDETSLESIRFLFENECCVAEANCVGSDSDVFILDSGCTDHMARNRNSLVNRQATDVRVGVAKRGAEIVAESIGDLEVRTSFGHQVKFTNVLCILMLRRNLISMTKLLLSGYRIEAEGREVRILKNEILVMIGELKDNLIMLKFNVVVPECERSEVISALTERIIEDVHDR